LCFLKGFFVFFSRFSWGLGIWGGAFFFWVFGFKFGGGGGKEGGLWIYVLEFGN